MAGGGGCARHTHHAVVGVAAADGQPTPYGRGRTGVGARVPPRTAAPRLSAPRRCRWSGSRTRLAAAPAAGVAGVGRRYRRGVARTRYGLPLPYRVLAAAAAYATAAAYAW